MTAAEPKTRVSNVTHEAPAEAQKRYANMQAGVERKLKKVYGLSEEDLNLRPHKQERFGKRMDGYIRSDTWTSKRDELIGYSPASAGNEEALDQLARRTLGDYIDGLEARRTVMRAKNRVAEGYDKDFYGADWTRYMMANANLNHITNQAMLAFEQLGLTPRSAESAAGTLLKKSLDMYRWIQPFVWVDHVPYRPSIYPHYDPKKSPAERLTETRNYWQTITTALNRDYPSSRDTQR